jgi:hypothetical protein
MNTPDQELESKTVPKEQDGEIKDLQTTLWESHIKISDPESGEILLNQRD